MFQILGELIGWALMVILGWAFFFKPERLVGYDGSPRELQKRTRHMKFCGIILMICGSILFIVQLVGLFIRF
jgi:hypothetical protein